MAQVCKTK